MNVVKLAGWVSPHYLADLSSGRSGLLHPASFNSIFKFIFFFLVYLQFSGWRNAIYLISWRSWTFFCYHLWERSTIIIIENFEYNLFLRELQVILQFAIFHLFYFILFYYNKLKIYIGIHYIAIASGSLFYLLIDTKPRVY